MKNRLAAFLYENLLFTKNMKLLFILPRGVGGYSQISFQIILANSYTMPALYSPAK